MDEAQFALCVLCFWPLLAIGVPFLLFLYDQGMLRFRVRTLLITTTVASVLLGLVVYVARK